MPQEPTVWDYVKALLTPWKGAPPPIPPLPQSELPPEGIAPAGMPLSEEEAATPQAATTFEVAAQPPAVISPGAEQPTVSAPPLPVETPPEVSLPQQTHFPWLSLIAFLLAVVAQRSLEPPIGGERSWQTGVMLYGVAVLCLLLAVLLRRQWQLAAPRPDENRVDPLTVNAAFLGFGVLLTGGAYFALGNNTFTTSNVFLWALALYAMLVALWLPGKLDLRQGWARAARWLKQPYWNVRISRWTLAAIAVVGLVLFFRFYRLPQIPPEMTSDHAEKLLDVWDVMHGQTSIFFPRNTGREAFQFYLTALIIRLFDTGYSFISLKLGTGLMGLLMLYYVYRLGNEIANRRVGLMALLLTGIGYWPVLVTRMGLRFSLYPLFVAPTLFYLIRGLRRRHRNDFLLAGLFLGLGLHGYSPFRIVPMLVVLGVGLYLLHRQSLGARRQTLWGFVALVVISIVVFLPLLRFTTDPAHPEYAEIFNYRSFTRLFENEQPFPDDPVKIFFVNLWRALVMFGWHNGDLWTVSIPGRPALDVVSAALFYLGIVLLLVRYLRQRHWLDLFLLLSIPVLLLPSVMSLAFPQENPILNRTSGAFIPAFLIVALTLDGWMDTFYRQIAAPWGKVAATSLGILALLLAVVQNYDLIFVQHPQLYQLSSWNTSEIGAVIRDFATTVGDYDHAWVVPYPYWVDTRLVGMNAGVPTRDYALWPDQLPQTLSVSGIKLFIFFPEDQQAKSVLQSLYPQGTMKLYRSPTGKNFMLDLVPESEPRVTPPAEPMP